MKSQMDLQFVEDFISNRDTPSILEWGSGYSTRALQKWPVKLTSIEHDKNWHEITKEFGATYVPINSYVEYPHEKYDVIIIDGRRRSDCLLRAPELLKEGGIVILDDAWRFRYWKAMSTYKEQKFLSRTTWIGNIKSSPINNWYWKFHCVIKNITKRLQLRGILPNPNDRRKD